LKCKGVDGEVSDFDAGRENQSLSPFGRKDAKDKQMEIKRF
jgi:hypothetical protein